MISPVKCCASAALPPLPKVYRMPRRSNARQSRWATSRASGRRAAAASPAATCSESCPAIHSAAVGGDAVSDLARSGIGQLLVVAGFAAAGLEQIEGDGPCSDGAHLVTKCREL